MNKKIKTLYSFQYKKYSYWIFLGVFISMLTAYYSWGQEFLTTFIAQRYVLSFIMLPAILYAQPTEKDIVKAIEELINDNNLRQKIIKNAYELVSDITLEKQTKILIDKIKTYGKV